MGRKSKIKWAFKQYNLDSILFGLWYLKDSLPHIQKAYTTTIAIEFSEPGSYSEKIEGINRDALLGLVHLATSFCLKNSEEGRNYSTGSNDIFYSVFNLIANQFSVSYDSRIDFARSFLIYEIIPNEIGNKNEFFLPFLFKEDKGYSIEQYLQICFYAFAAIVAHGKFADDYFIKASQIVKVPNFETINCILSDISATAVHYRRERKKVNSAGSFKYQPILMYPLIKPWSNIPKTYKRKRYLAPLPNLIPHKSNMGIYHHFLSRYKTDFTTYFGKEIFERYIRKALDSCCYGEFVMSEGEIKKKHKIPNSVKIPDFLIIDNNRGIIVECKAAVLPLGVYIRGDVDDFRTTVEKLSIGVRQLANFEEYALSNSFYNVSEWIRLLVTYEPLWGMDTTILSDILLADFKKEDAAIFKDYFNQAIILPSSQLDCLQPHVSKDNTIFSVLERLKKISFNDVYQSLINETGRSLKDSYLYKYFELLIGDIG